MSNYKIFKSVYVDEYGKRKTFIGIPYWKSIRHYDGGEYTGLTRFYNYDDALNFIQNVLEKGIKLDDINTELVHIY
jgi:hypothetical protein